MRIHLVQNSFDVTFSQSQKSHSIRGPGVCNFNISYINSLCICQSKATDYFTYRLFWLLITQENIFLKLKKFSSPPKKYWWSKQAIKEIIGSSTLADSKAIGVQSKKKYHKTSEVRIIVK